MTLKVKYWAFGDSAPANWTDVDVLSFYSRPVYEGYESDTALDGTKVSFRRKRYKCTIVPGPLTMNSSTPRGYIEALLAAYNVRVSDTRYSYLGTSNTINFVHPKDDEPSREQNSLLTEDYSIDLITESVQ